MWSNPGMCGGGRLGKRAHRRVAGLTTYSRGCGSARSLDSRAAAKQKALAVIHDLDAHAGQEIEPSVDRRARRGAGEELREVILRQVDEDASHRARKQATAQAVVDGIAPRLADPPGLGQDVRRETPEDLRERVVG